MSAQRITSISVALFLFALNLPEIVAQAVSILPTTPSSTFPACALGCNNLNAAASYCVQTNVGASQQTVNSCFCQRAEVTPFYVSSAGVCDAFCISDTDRSTLQAWFQTYCAAAGFSAGSGGTVTTLITSTRTPTATATGAPKAGSGTDSTSSSSQNDGWYGSIMTLHEFVRVIADFDCVQVCYPLEMDSHGHCSCCRPERSGRSRSMSQASPCAQSPCATCRLVRISCRPKWKLTGHWARARYVGPASAHGAHRRMGIYV
jgi:hypothetical protein